MIAYHGTPCGATRVDVARFLAGRHALIPWPRNEDIGTAAEVCQTFCLDNGAFSAWKSGSPITNWNDYYNFCREWHRHPGFDFCIVPDVIDGDEKANDDLWAWWSAKNQLRVKSAPVWHLHESLERLDRLVQHQRLCGEIVCLGSSGQWATPGTEGWWRRIAEAMKVACDEQGRPRCKLHGLRMLDAAIFTRLPLASADSTNAVRNSSNVRRFGQYCPPAASGCMSTIADRIERHQSAAVWVPMEEQGVLVWHEVKELEGKHA